MATERVEDLLRTLAPRVLAVLVRRHGQFDACEDAVQEALLAAATSWPADGVPREPVGWLVTVAGRRLTDQWRSESARRRREVTVAVQQPYHELMSPDPAEESGRHTDDTLTLLFLCCHPSLTPASRIALTLRAVGGLTTVEIARAFLVPEPTMSRRITRAKRTLQRVGTPFAPPADRDRRLGSVLHVLYLVFTEGYAATSGPDLHRAELTAEAIRLARIVHRLLPDDPEVAGLLALMLLTDARRPARTGEHGELVPMAEQDRSRWLADAITEGIALITDALPRGATGPYQLQAAIAAVHAEAPSAEETDWLQIAALYELLRRVSDNPVVALNQVVAIAMAHGPAVGLARLDEVAADERLAGDHRPLAVRAHLLERSGEPDAAREAYLAAAAMALSLPQRRYLNARAARLTSEEGAPRPDAGIM